MMMTLLLASSFHAENFIMCELSILWDLHSLYHRSLFLSLSLTTKSHSLSLACRHAVQCARSEIVVVQLMPDFRRRSERYGGVVVGGDGAT